MTGPAAVSGPASPAPPPLAPTLVADVVVRRGTFELAVAFRAEPGRTLALVGPNGAGKSTTLAAIAGLTALHAGRITLGNRVLDEAQDPRAHVPTEARRIGVVFQDFLLFPHLTVRDNIAFALRMPAPGRPRLGRRAAREQAEPWITHFDLGDLAERYPASLSGGQAQRVALARALASEPELLLLDEPLASLDVEVRDEVRDDLARRLAEVPVATVVVTHDAADAAALAADVVVIEAGAITQSGAWADVAANPATPYVERLSRRS
ncbi:MAG TPA: ATP-binding cassette domain-containing protein [Pseudolysinimonas sp.]|nr:ATP-binding cassette domain-containing protein [Pseudolysinimonas sp.]